MDFYKFNMIKAGTEEGIDVYCQKSGIKKIIAERHKNGGILILNNLKYNRGEDSWHEYMFKIYL